MVDTRTASLTLPTDDDEWLDAELIEEMNAAAGYKSDRGRQNAAYVLAAFARWLQAHHASLLEVTTTQCRAYLDERAETIAPATVVRTWSILKKFYAVAERHSTDPLAGRRSPMRDVAQPWAPEFADTHAATPAEYAAMMATLTGPSSLTLRNQIALSLMFRSGLRVGELAGIDLAHLDVEGRFVRIPLTKNGKPRRVPLDVETLGLLRRYLHPRRRGDTPGPLLVNVGGRRASARLTTNAIQNIVKRVAARAGVPVSPHALRRGAVVEYMSHPDASEAHAMEIFGWSKTVMLYRYLADARADSAQVSFERGGERRTSASREQRALRAVR